MERDEQSNQVWIMAIRQENNDQLDSMKNNITSRFTNFNETIENVKNQFKNQGEKLENLQHLQTNLQGEVDIMGLRSTCNAQPVSYTHLCMTTGFVNSSANC